MAVARSGRRAVLRAAPNARPAVTLPWHSAVTERLRRSQRIRRRPEFQRVHEQGARAHGRFMTVLTLPNNLETSRLGIVAARKLGGAVVRNRAKRLIREVFRRSAPPDPIDVVVIPRREMLDAELLAIEADFRAALRRPRRRG